MICDDCNEAYIEGDKAIFATVTALEDRIKWLEDGLRDLLSIGNEVKAIATGLLDGNPTTADEHNTMQEDEKLVYEDEHNCMIQYDDPGDENDNIPANNIKKLIKKYPNDQELGDKVRSMITSIGYRGED